MNSGPSPFDLVAGWHIQNLNNDYATAQRSLHAAYRQQRAGFELLRAHLHETALDHARVDDDNVRLRKDLVRLEAAARAALLELSAVETEHRLAMGHAP